MTGRRAVGSVLPGVRRPLLSFLLLLVLAVPPAAGQTGAARDTPPATPDGATPPESPPPESPPVNVDGLPISVERIQQRLEREPAIDLVPSRPMFRIEVIELRPRWFDVEIDWTDGRAGLPTPVRPAWHDQFLSMVTPHEAMPYGAFTGTDLLQVMATSIVQGLATNAIASRVRDAARERRQEQAREEVDEAIARWKREREDADRAKPVDSAPPP